MTRSAVPRPGRPPARRRGDRRGRCFALAATATLTLAACASHGGGGAVPLQFAAAYRGLCAAEASARAGHEDTARATFFDRAHGQLHQLATEATSRDRAAGARLLEAMLAVERDFVRQGRLADDLGRLRAAVARALSATRYRPPRPCSP